MKAEKERVAAPADWLIAGSVAAAASAAVLAACGYLENGRPAGPNNGPSQWLWGRRAAHQRRFSVRHTVTGYAIHHGSSLFWSVIHTRLFPRPASPPRTVPRELMEGAITAALACLVDYRLTPRRFQPGFEAQLGKCSLLLTYATFGATLALARRLMQPPSGPAGPLRLRR